MSIFKQKSRHKTEQKIIRVQEPIKRAPSAPATQRNGSLRAPPAAASIRANGTPRGSPRPGARAGGSARVASASPLPYSSSGDERMHARARSLKRKAPPGASSRSPASSRLTDDDEDDEDGDDNWEDRLDPRKRQKRRELERPEDPDRRLRHAQLWDGDDATAKEIRVRHAVDVASLAKAGFQATMGLGPDELSVELQYPGSRYPERFDLVYAKEELDPVEEILSVVRHVASFYLTDEQSEPFFASDPNPGIHRRLDRARNCRNGLDFKAALAEYNERLLALQRDGVIGRNLDAASPRGVPRELAAFILEQSYNRTVALKVELLKKYENGTSEVYGELLQPFVSDILRKTNVASRSVFVDLGSGVGNVVLQAALEAGCESWGCELMENPCNLADEQRVEFAARCRLWGIAPGKFHLERGDFRRNERILAVLGRADVILVNNFVFDAALNNSLVQMFLDLKVGAKVVSLRSFVHDQKNGSNDVAASIFDVETLTFPEDYVSWSSTGGTYYISTRK